MLHTLGCVAHRHRLTTRFDGDHRSACIRYSARVGSEPDYGNPSLTTVLKKSAETAPLDLERTVDQQQNVRRMKRSVGAKP